ncbi:hypothetical protein [endosymbiont of Lamellibrachia barhami]|uniref:hypothetical protein n=1 Tax=endosymbiont of Lamellibrachia barhami TaxID=205975 RepID=UPI0015AA32E6|nr:hypothetical protein [endosymbiont of Lamellibrachia barhami]
MKRINTLMEVWQLPGSFVPGIRVGVKTWHLVRKQVIHRNRTLNARDLFSLWQEIALAKEKLKRPEETLIVSCFEAGRDGHWLHRALTAQGIHNLEVSSTSIKVSQQANCKTADWTSNISGKRKHSSA